MPGLEPQPNQLKPLPAPLQAANCRSCKLEPFRNAHPLYPKHLPFCGDAQDELPALISRHLLIGEEVLQLDRTGHTNGLETVTRLPMPQADEGTDFVRVKTLPSYARCRTAERFR